MKKKKDYKSILPLQKILSFQLHCILPSACSDSCCYTPFCPQYAAHMLMYRFKVDVVK